MNYGKLQVMDDILRLAKLLEPIADHAGFHIGLTGGQLYKEGERKDIDFVVYGTREGADKLPDINDLMVKWSNSLPDFQCKSFHGYVTKATWKGYDLDFLYPEFDGVNSYEEHMAKQAKEAKVDSPFGLNQFMP